MVKFFEAIYIDIFKHLVITSSNNNDLLRPVSIYFKTIKINNWSIFNYHCLIWFCKAF